MNNNFQVSSRPWYKCTEIGGTFMTEPYEDVSTGKTVVTVSTPIYNVVGQIIGVAGLDILLDDVIEIVSECTIGESGYVMLLSTDGMFIYHPNQQYINTYIADMDISKEVIDAVLSNQGIYTKYKANGENKFGSVTNVGDTGYVVISSITSSEYFREIYYIGAEIWR